MNPELLEYLKDINNDTANFNLATWYDNGGYKSPATSFYLKCAEVTDDILLAYECLLKIFQCYKSLGNRDYTCESVLKHAIQLQPKNPEAYWLISHFYEQKGNWLDAYLYSCIGFECSNKTPSKLRTDIGYHSEYLLLFQKAVSSWWVGKPKEARKLFRQLKDQYRDVMHEYYLSLVQNNLTNLGSGSDDESAVRYNKDKYDLRFKFCGSNELARNYSQAGQDLFILAALDGKRNGTYLEIGSAYSYHNSNTALLEQFGWHGVGIELKPELADMHKRERKNKCLNTDALKINYEKLLDENFTDTVIDYLQLDIEPSKNTFEALLAIPFHKYKFRVITYEHDSYVDLTGQYREKSRRYLQNMGYTLIFNDIAPLEGCNFEDWWIHKDLIDNKIIEDFKSYPLENINLVENLMFKKKHDKLKNFPVVNFIGLEESEDRRNNLKEQFLAYGITNLRPYLFKRYHECKHILAGNYVDKLHDNSKGPVTSHIKAIKEWYDSTNDDYAFFCEDDLSLENVPYWNFTWSEFMLSLPNDWECVQLTWIRPSNTDIGLRIRWENDWGAAAYLIKRTYAKKIIDQYYVDGNIFNLNIGDSDLIPIVENAIFSLGKTYNIPIFVEDVNNVRSTYFGKDPTEINGQGEYHWDSYRWITGFWKNQGSRAELKDLLKVRLPHIYHESRFGEDWFTYPNLYKNMVTKFSSGSKFVEVGSWKGKSSAFMAVEIANSNKDISFFCIDNWKGSAEHQNMDTKTLYEIFQNNMKSLEKYYIDIRMDSLEAVKIFDDNSLDFVFIDASHEYEDVKKDILAWLPKVKIGGILAGHDYYLDCDYYPGVKKAVNECLNNFTTSENCYIYEKT